MKMYLAAANTQFQQTVCLTCSLDYLMGRERSLGYIQNLHCKKENTPTEGEKNCKLPQEETQQMNNTHHQTQWQILMTTNMDQIQ